MEEDNLDYEVEVTNSEQTFELGKKLAPFLLAKDLILLDGDLGAGKTTFTKGLASGLGIKKNVKSPTFTIIREYQEGRLPLYHMDAYRLEEGGADELGLDEYFNGDGVNVVEWSKFINEDLPENYLRIVFLREDDQAENDRKLILKPNGSRFEEISQKLVHSNE
ncbi:ATPase or kinase [Secundilactobacillus malefermentans DSM 5705 = KCTC 3548]|nr:ATPase or kinase [Secundilactobacillus malefermentans DSM 5705 = KCTC 3548]